MVVLEGFAGDFGRFLLCFLNSLTSAYWWEVSDLPRVIPTFSGLGPNFS